jgi:hypothetical protein
LTAKAAVERWTTPQQPYAPDFDFERLGAGRLLFSPDPNGGRQRGGGGSSPEDKMRAQILGAEPAGVTALHAQIERGREQRLARYAAKGDPVLKEIRQRIRADMARDRAILLEEKQEELELEEKMMKQGRDTHHREAAAVTTLEILGMDSRDTWDVGEGASSSPSASSSVPLDGPYSAATRKLSPYWASAAVPWRMGPAPKQALQEPEEWAALWTEARAWAKEQREEVSNAAAEWGRLYDESMAFDGGFFSGDREYRGNAERKVAAGSGGLDASSLPFAAPLPWNEEKGRAMKAIELGYHFQVGEDADFDDEDEEWESEGREDVTDLTGASDTAT